MCGIAGLLSTKFDQAIAATQLAAMRNALTHRGPDGHGEFFSPSQKAALAHTRLAIIDLSSTGAQPMSLPGDRYTITFNGEIYNYQSLRQELEADGMQFISNSDTEVILALYAKHGAAAVSKLRGMFAFLVWDEVEQTGFAARDPLGIKPLYYWHDNSSLALASEMRALLTANTSSKQINPVGLNSYLQTGTVSEPHTLLSDIQMLPAGHTLSWSKGKVETSAYWQINFASQAMSLEQAQASAREALIRSIKAHFVADVPVGVFLSGGIDSSAIVALAKHATTQTINTYSIAFEDPGWNEGDIALRVADHFGTRHTEFLVTPEIARPLFTHYLNAVDQPTIDGFNTFCVAKLARDQGEKVVLSGLGGDELFAGYKSFEMLPKMLKNSVRLKALKWLVAALEYVANPLIPAKARRVVDLLRWPGSLSAAHTSLRGVFSRSESVALASAFGVEAHSTQHQTHQGDLADAISEQELSTYMRNQLLRDSDAASMAWGLELRVPFVDQVLFDQLSQIPVEHRLRYGKKLLTEAVPEIPEWVVNRPKQGFRFPFDDWFSEQWQDIEIPQTIPKWIKLEPWYRRWSLVILNHWLARYAK